MKWTPIEGGGGVYGVGGFLEGWKATSRMWRRIDGGEKGMEKRAFRKGTRIVRWGKGWTGVAAPILTLSENWGT